MPSFRDLVERRVPQFFAIYLGAGWGLIEFMSFLEERFSISPDWTNLFLFAWVLLIPTVLIYTWNHGRPGRDEFTRFEKLAIPLNLVLVIVVLGTAFGGADLRATMTQVTLRDEDGNEVTRSVARDGFRKRVAFFAFDAAQVDSSTAWLREGAMLALAMDLSQDMFIDMRLPQQFRKQLREAGSDGYNVQLGIKRQIAEEMHLPYFVAGRVQQGVEGFTLTAQLYRTADSKLIAERTVTEPTLFAAADELSTLMRQDLELPQARPQGEKDLPVATFLSENMDAYRAHVEGTIAAQDDQWPVAEQHFARAAQLDPTYALAQFALYQSRALQGNAQAAMPALEQAMRQLARVPERSSFMVKAEYFIMKQDMDKAFAVADMMTQLYPDDLTGWALRAQLQIYRGDYAGSIESLRAAYALDETQQELLLQVGALLEQMGRFDEALAEYQKYADGSPNDVSARLRIARMQMRMGHLADARATMNRALLVDPTAVEPAIDMAMLERSEGNIDAAVRQLQSALSSATTADDSMSVHASLSAVYEFAGRMQLSLEQAERTTTVASRVQLPVQVLGQKMSSLSGYVLAGRTADARRILADVRSRMSPPMDEMWRQGQLTLAMELRDSTELKEARDGVQRIIDAFGFQMMRPDIVRADAVLAELRGDWQGALAKYEEVQKLDPASLNVKRDMARVYRSLNRLDDAQRVIDEHLRVVPASPQSHIEAARIKLARGDRAGARQHLERAAQVWANADPSFTLTAELRTLQQQAR